MFCILDTLKIMVNCKTDLFDFHILCWNRFVITSEVFRTNDQFSEIAQLCCLRIVQFQEIFSDFISLLVIIED
jgi:hypothetical protein